jgi:hypothetical protein
MGKWEPYDRERGIIRWKGDGLTVYLQGDKVRHLNDEWLLSLREYCLQCNFAIADVLVSEWGEICLWVEEVEPDHIRRVWFGGREAARNMRHNEEWRFVFCNYLGKSSIVVELSEGRQVKTDPIEVVSEKTLPHDGEKLKTDEPLFYPAFLSALTEALKRYLVTLPFHWETPTEFPTTETAQPSHPFFILHTLIQNARKIRFALQTILRTPHRRLVTEERWARLDEAARVNSDTVLMMLMHPEHLRRVYGSALPENPFSLAQKLKGKMPERVFERRVIESLDTPENRFIKQFMDIVLFWRDELRRLGYWDEATTHQGELDELYGFVRLARIDPMFADVGELELFPSSSQVLLRRDGYRECLEVYRQLHLARMPFFERLQEALDNRRIDQLYEFWCFFKLAEELAKVLGEDGPRFEGFSADERGGLRYGLKAELPEGYELVYNRTFKRGDGGSYSIPLRPDFSLFRNGKLQVVFDAKFRFDVHDITDLSDLIEHEMDEASYEGDVERLAKHADLCKMHTYRDALRCRAAFVLYPGTESKFYEVEGEEKNCVDIPSIVKYGCKGIGAFPLIPLEGSEMT